MTGAILAVVVVGCDLMVAPPASLRPSRVVSTPEPTPEPTPTEVDEFETLPPEPTEGALSLVGTAEALADLESYVITVATRGLVPSATPGGAVVMTATMIQGDEPAARFALTGADGLVGGRLEVVVIGDRGWLREGSGAWRVSPGGAADFDAAFTTMSPSELTRPFEPLAPALQRMGFDRRNGIRSEHFRAESSDPVVAEAGLAGGSIDLWRSETVGYLVALDLEGGWVGDDGTAGRTVLRIEVSRANDPANDVAPPR